MQRCSFLYASHPAVQQDSHFATHWEKESRWLYKPADDTKKRRGLQYVAKTNAIWVLDHLPLFLDCK